MTTKRDNLKIYHRIAAVITLALFGLMLWDILAHGSQWFVPLLIIMCVHLFVELVFILVTFFRHDEDVEFRPTGREYDLYTRDGRPVHVLAVHINDSRQTAQIIEEPATPAKPAPKKAAPKKKPAGRLDYKGDVHEVVDLEGIGPTYAKRLIDAGIVHTQHLLFASNARVQKIAGASARNVKLWKEMSQLVKINGVGPQYAEAMARAGITFEGLRSGDPAKMAVQVRTYLDGLKSNIIGGSIGAQRLATWKEAAKKMRKVSIDLAAIRPVRIETKAAKETGVAKKATKPSGKIVGA